MRLISIIVGIAASITAHAVEVEVGTLNTESASDTQAFRVAELIRKIGKVHVWAFQEVASVDAAIEYTVAAGAVANRKSYRYVVSESGEINAPHREHDHLAIVYNSSDLRQVETVELHGIRSNPGLGRLGNPEWRLCGALLLRLQHRSTGLEFYVGNVRLKCCGDRDNGPAIRAHQVQIVKEWVDRSDVSVILAGDFNIPIDPGSGDGNPSSVAFTTLQQSLDWHRPSNPITTQCSRRFNSMLDHVFLKGNPNIEVKNVEIQETEADYCEMGPEGYPDHRPVFGYI